MNDQNEPMLDYVLRNLDAATARREQISQASGVPYWTIAKISQRRVTNPRIETLQALHDYFRGIELEQAS